VSFWHRRLKSLPDGVAAVAAGIGHMHGLRKEGRRRRREEGGVHDNVVRP